MRLPRHEHLRCDLASRAVVEPEQCGDADSADEQNGDRDPPSPGHGMAGSACVPDASGTTCTGSSYASTLGVPARGCCSSAIAMRMRMRMMEIRRPTCTSSLRYSITTRCRPGVTITPWYAMLVTTAGTGRPSTVMCQYLCGVTLMTRKPWPRLS